MPPRSVIQEAGAAALRVDLDAGARLASLEVGGHELLVGDGPGPIEWGCYPMAPWAGRVRDGRFRFAGAEHRLPPTLGRHAIHGTVLDVPWQAVEDGHFTATLAAPWPWPGEVRSFVRLEPDRLHLRLEVHAAAAPMPASCGWHPWFLRRVGGAAARLDFRADHMLRRGPDGVPTGERVPVPPGPWDDCFGGIDGPAVVTWPGVLRLEVASTCDYLVVYDERAHALCVEPQTAPPDALNHTPFVVEPGRPLIAQSTWTWTLL